MNKMILLPFFILLLGTSILASAKEHGDDKKKEAEQKDLIVTLTPTNYDDVISKGLVIVDFWAAWCAPCRRMSPILHEVAEEREGKVTIAKLDTDDYREFSLEKKVQALPTLIIYKDGKELTRTSGLVTKQKLLEVVDYLLLEKEVL